jgi:hypothetical protein
VSINNLHQQGEFDLAEKGLESLSVGPIRQAAEVGLANTLILALMTNLLLLMAHNEAAPAA